MRSQRKVYYALGLAFCLAASLGLAAGKPRTTSTSRQFLVYGGDAKLRGTISNQAEQTKAHLLRLLGLRDNWKTPLLISLHYPQANLPDVNPAALELSQLGFGLKFQLNLLVTKELRGRALQEPLLRGILLEMMYRERANIAAGTPYVAPPDWLLSGFLGLQAGRESDSDAQLLKTVVTGNKIPPLAQIVEERRSQLDAPSRKFFDAYSRALLQLLLDAPGGRGKVVQYLNDLPEAPNDALADLRVHFPETLGRAPDKWWALSVARLSASDRHQTLSARETAQQLDRALRFSLRGADGTSREYSLGEYEAFRKAPGHERALQQVGRQLLLLSARGHPSYRAIVQEAFELADLLARGKTEGVGARLNRVASYRAVIEQQAEEIDDYLNWYEGTQPKTMSGAFSQLLEAGKAADEALPRRRDPISIYLDSIEMEME